MWKHITTPLLEYVDPGSKNDMEVFKDAGNRTIKNDSSDGVPVRTRCFDGPWWPQSKQLGTTLESHRTVKAPLTVNGYSRNKIKFRLAPDHTVVVDQLRKQAHEFGNVSSYDCNYGIHDDCHVCGADLDYLESKDVMDYLDWMEFSEKAHTDGYGYYSDEEETTIWTLTKDGYVPDLTVEGIEPNPGPGSNASRFSKSSKGSNKQKKEYRRKESKNSNSAVTASLADGYQQLQGQIDSLRERLIEPSPVSVEVSEPVPEVQLSLRQRLIDHSDPVNNAVNFDLHMKKTGLIYDYRSPMSTYCPKVLIKIMKVLGVSNLFLLGVVTISKIVQYLKQVVLVRRLVAALARTGLLKFYYGVVGKILASKMIYYPTLIGFVGLPILPKILDYVPVRNFGIVAQMDEHVLHRDLRPDTNNLMDLMHNDYAPALINHYVKFPLIPRIYLRSTVCSMELMSQLSSPKFHKMDASVADTYVRITNAASTIQKLNIDRYKFLEMDYSFEDTIDLSLRVFKTKLDRHTVDLTSPFDPIGARGRDLN